MSAAVTAPATFSEAQDRLAAALPGYTRRPQQMLLAEQIEQAIAGGRIGLMQAGCGTGKSLAALIPAIQSGKRTIVATATRALQGQYRTSDLPFLTEHLGLPFTWAVLKGRSNYACHARIAELADPTPAQRQIIADVKAADAGEHEISGDRDELPAVSDREWSALSMSAAECPGKKNCPFAKQCFAEKAKARAAESRIVITNLAYLITDFVLRDQTDGTVSLLGEIDQLILDEAHNLEDAVTSALSDSIGLGTFARLARDADNFLHDAGLDENGYKILANAEWLWEKIVSLYAAWLRRNNVRKPEPMGLTRRAIYDELGDNLAGLTSAISEVRDQVKAYRPLEDRDKLLRYRLLGRLEDWNGRLQDFALQPDTETVRWIEQEEVETRRGSETRAYLKSAPVEVGPFLRKNIWNAIPAVLMSATLATGTSFEYIRERLGLEAGEPVEFLTPSPFDYPAQARLLIPPKDAPQPSGPTAQAWRAYAQQVTRHLVLEGNGGALLLFTSRTGLNESYRALADDFRAAGLTVLKQGEAPTSELIRRFKQGRAVLFGLKSFFEGIDVQGEACHLVVIDKLPFAVPTDILVQARYAAVERRYGRGKSFSKMALPTMVLVLTQGIGRLIRHMNDRGVVAILDSRLMARGYGASILRQLPPAPQTTDIREAVAFLRGA